MESPTQLSGTVITPRTNSTAPLLQRRCAGGCGGGVFEISFTRMTSRCVDGGVGDSAAATELASGSTVSPTSLCDTAVFGFCKSSRAPQFNPCKAFLTLISFARNQARSTDL